MIDHAENNLLFKKGSKYSRVDVGWIMLPETGRPKGGAWDTGYVRIDDKLIIFMNIGVPGLTGHDFDNYYDETNKTITWYGKPNSHSKQSTFQKLLSGEYIPYFFARWNNRDRNFIFLGIGHVISYKDGMPAKDSKGNDIETIEVKLTIADAEYIIPNKSLDNYEVVENPVDNIKSSFALEKHLEDFIVKNWAHTPLGKKYDIYEDGQQFRTRSGPLDILAISKDKREFLVIELKKGRASDEVFGQISRYMGWIQKEIATNNENVKGMIIALEDDINLRDSLRVNPNIKFMRYEIKFELKE